MVAEDYVGSTEDDAKERLEALGLEVNEEKVENPGDAVEDTVAAVSPTGPVEEGTEVTLSIYDQVKGKPEDVPGKGDEKDD
ncbi:MAG: PASTA domain-containing protein [Nocardioides sp.]